jgi:hypothetical protein
MKVIRSILFTGVFALLTLTCFAYENLAAKQRYTDALNCTSSRIVNNATKAHQNLLQAQALDKSKLTLVGPDPNSEKLLNDAALNLEAYSSAKNPNHHCYQAVLSLMNCYHLDNCQ